jgi:hypothetical protein
MLARLRRRLLVKMIVLVGGDTQIGVAEQETHLDEFDARGNQQDRRAVPQTWNRSRGCFVSSRSR